MSHAELRLLATISDKQTVGIDVSWIPTVAARYGGP
jgi:hypothetical protein